MRAAAQAPIEPAKIVEAAAPRKRPMRPEPAQGCSTRTLISVGSLS